MVRRAEFALARPPRALPAWLVAVALFVVACGSPGVRTARPAGTAVEPALDIAAWLPSTADECVLALPARLSRSEAAAFGAISQADGWVWQLDSPPVAYARAAWTHGPRRRWLVLLRFAGDASSSRAWLAQRSGLDLHWQGTDAVSCDGDTCPVLTSLLDRHTVRLVHGPIPPDVPVHPGNVCAALLRRQSHALEVSARREDSAQGLSADLPSERLIRTQAFAYKTPTMVVLERDAWLAGDEAAARSVERDACRELFGAEVPLIDAVCERTRNERRVHTRVWLRWQDLHMRVADAARHARAQRYAEALPRVRADDDVDWSNIDDAYRELATRKILIDNSGAAAGERARALLQRVRELLATHPREPRLLALEAELEPIAEVMTPGGRPAMTPP